MSAIFESELQPRLTQKGPIDSVIARHHLLSLVFSDKLMASHDKMKHFFRAFYHLPEKDHNINLTPFANCQTAQAIPSPYHLQEPQSLHVKATSLEDLRRVKRRLGPIEVSTSSNSDDKDDTSNTSNDNFDGLVISQHNEGKNENTSSSDKSVTVAPTISLIVSRTENLIAAISNKPTPKANANKKVYEDLYVKFLDSQAAILSYQQSTEALSKLKQDTSSFETVKTTMATHIAKAKDRAHELSEEIRDLEQQLTVKREVKNRLDAALIKNEGQFAKASSMLDSSNAVLQSLEEKMLSSQEAAKEARNFQTALQTEPGAPFPCIYLGHGQANSIHRNFENRDVNCYTTLPKCLQRLLKNNLFVLDSSPREILWNLSLKKSSNCGVGTRVSHLFSLGPQQMLLNLPSSCLRRCSLLASTPGFNVTKAQGDSPHFSSGLATTDASRIAGCVYITFSISTLLIFSAPEMIMSFDLSLISMYPSGCFTARSPE
ncbi:hypothetical protein Ahy_B01g055565 [Arachis hypogaea]|uniref:Uncharacterized protein n=1 Tax=Arachis hypogaea TaxID=3818 RepID=A0A445AWH8_ARAHY|nr:hypothetical protein Ahy_B01g055565 [Arachis hypogaea]